MAYDGLAVKQAERLDRETEQMLAHRWRKEADTQALQRIVTAYIPLALSQAAKTQRFGTPIHDFRQAALVGMTKAATKFDPDRNIRFFTYAPWWIRDELQKCAMRYRSLIPIGSSENNRALFFRGRAIQLNAERAAAEQGEQLTEQQLHQAIALELEMDPDFVAETMMHLSGVVESLNVPISNDNEDGEWIDLLVHPGPDAAKLYEKQCFVAHVRKSLIEAFQFLTERERYVMMEFKLSDDERTLKDIAGEWGVTYQTVQQQYYKARDKLKRKLRHQGIDVRILRHFA